MTKLLAEPGAGEQLGRYELVAEIASGGMATVYLARAIGMVDFRRFFAVKRLHPHLAKDPDFVAMFIDEAKLAARIHHPNVVPIFEIGMKDEQYFLVMDYIEGDTASRLIVRAKHSAKLLPIGFTVRVLVDTLAGLHAAHELANDEGKPLEIIHRDVSPQNILVGVDGVARITDFGVARAAARIGERTQTGHLKGKLAYMAPEQIRGGVVDRRVDVFAAGIVLWEMLAGERLFKAETDGETLFKVAAAEVPELTQLVPGLPPPIAEVCLRALAKDPADRWATAADFGDALEAAARTAGTMFTARESAALVNELVGQEITAHRDLVRTWLTRSDVSRSGVALAQPFSPPRTDALDPVNGATPESGSHAAPVVQPPPEPPPQPELRNLGNLTSDHDDLATRIDLDIDEQPAVDANGLPMTPPAPPPAAPAAMPNIPQPATVPEFYPAAVLQAMQSGANPALPPGAFVPGQAPPPPQFAPPPMAPRVAPVAPAQRRVPTWLLAIPILLIVGVGGAVIVLKSRGETPPPPTTTKTTATQTATQTAEVPTTTTATTTTATATATTTTTTTATTTTVASATSPLPTTTVKPTAVPTTTGPRPTTTVVTTAIKPTAVPTATTSKPKPIDNSAFGGRK